MCLLFMLLGINCIDATYKGNVIFILILSENDLHISTSILFYEKKNVSSLLIILYFSFFSLLFSSIKSLQEEMDDRQFIASHAYEFCIIPIIRHH